MFSYFDFKESSSLTQESLKRYIFMAVVFKWICSLIPLWLLITPNVLKYPAKKTPVLWFNDKEYQH